MILKVYVRSDGTKRNIAKTNDVKIFTDLLTNKMFSKNILSWNFKIELSLKKGLICT